MHFTAKPLRMREKRFTVEAVVQERRRSTERSLNEGTFQSMLAEKICGRKVVRKMAESGLKLMHVVLSFKRGGENGVKILLSEKDSNGRIRVTNSKRIVSRITEFVKKSVDNTL